MSAVGLLLLEDPKARARAEARIRNGQTKRRSFFGRSGNAQSKGRRPNLPPTIPDEDEDAPVIVRPSTSMSIVGSSKKKHDGSERSNSRNSIFGRKDSVGASSIRSGNSGSSQYSGAVSMSSYATHASDAGDRQASSSHSHMISGALPTRSALPLATVEERDLPVRAWTSHGPQPSRLQTNSAQRNRGLSDLDNDAAAYRSRPLPPVGLEPPSLPPAARISTFDDTIFNTVNSPAESTEETHHKSPLRQAENAFGSSNSLLASSESISRSNSHPRVPGAFPSTESVAKEAAPPVQTTTSPPGPVLVSAATQTASDSQEDLSTDTQQGESTQRPEDASQEVAHPLPSQNASDPSLRSHSTDSSHSNANPEVRIDYSRHPYETAYARSSVSTGKSPALSFTSGVRESTVFSDSTWEDDIDFVYEQGAEAACDFDWQFEKNGRMRSIQSDGVVRLSNASGAFHAQAPSVSSDVSRRDSRTLSGVVSTIAERRQAQKVAESTRGFSVGHRGFAAARNSEDSSHKRSLPPTPTHLNLAHPVKDGLNYGLPNPDSGTPRSPFTPNIMQFPVPPAGGRQSDNISEPESWRNGPKHRKSSSYGSIESSARISAATTSAKDTNRWSSASQSSVPSLIHSRAPKRTSSVNKGMISAPVSVLPQHPENDQAFEVETRPGGEASSVPPGQPSPDHDSFVMRRPQTAGERLLLQAAGRQRYRPATPNGGPVAPRVYQPTTDSSGKSSTPAGSSWI